MRRSRGRSRRVLMTIPCRDRQGAVPVSSLRSAPPHARATLRVALARAGGLLGSLAIRGRVGGVVHEVASSTVVKEAIS
jgi:hypothetical protein